MQFIIIVTVHSLLGEGKKNAVCFLVVYSYTAVLALIVQLLHTVAPTVRCIALWYSIVHGFLTIISQSLSSSVEACLE